MTDIQQSLIYEIPLKDIAGSKFNVRMTEKDKGIDELAESIKNHGLLQPVMLKGEIGAPPYELIIGQRRYLAHKKLGKQTIKATFCSNTLTDQAIRIISLAENLHRVELNFADKTTAISKLYEDFGRNATRVGKELGISYVTVLEYVNIDKQASPKAKEMMKQHILSKEDVKRAITASQGDSKKADILLDRIKDLTKYEKDRLVNYGRSKPKASASEILADAQLPKFERVVVLNLNENIDKALSKAKDKLLMDKETIATQALIKWLKTNGFLAEDGRVID